MKRLPYKEGTWFAVTLKNGGYAVGRVARKTRKGGGLLCYFFGPRLGSIPTLENVKQLRPEDALCVWIIGDLHLIENKWPILGDSEDWNRTEWPMPIFVRTCLHTGRRKRIYYSDDDPSKEILEERDEPPMLNLESDGVYGSEAVEIALNMRLSK